LVTGARASERGWPTADRALVGVVAARLVGVPLVVAAVGALALRVGLVEDAVAVAVVVLVAAMPVAVSAPPMVDRFVGGDDLAARAVAASTPLALGTVPLVLWAFDWMRGA
jgi:predicted permease